VTRHLRGAADESNATIAPPGSEPVEAESNAAIAPSGSGGGRGRSLPARSGGVRPASACRFGP
jgi:hypothetical protein